MPRVRDPKRTRRKVLEASYREFYRHGFQGGSINRIVTAAGITRAWVVFMANAMQLTSASR